MSAALAFHFFFFFNSWVCHLQVNLVDFEKQRHAFLDASDSQSDVSIRGRIKSFSSGVSGNDFRIVIIASIVINCIVLAIPLYINRIYTSVVPQQAADSLAAITILLVLVLVFDVVLKALRTWVLSWLSASTEHRLRMQAVRSVLGSTSKDVRRLPLKVRLAQLRSPAVLRTQLEQQWIVRHIDLPFSLLYLLVLGVIGGWLIVPPLIVAPVFILLSKGASLSAVRSARSHHHLEVNRNQLVVNGIGLASTIKTFNLEGFLVRRLEPLQERLSQSMFEQESAIAKLQNLSSLFSQINQLLIVSVGGWLVIQQELSTGALAACTLLSGQVAAPLGKFFVANGQRAKLEQAVNDFQQLIDLPQEANLMVGADSLPTELSIGFCGQSLTEGQTLLLHGGTPGQSTMLINAFQDASAKTNHTLTFGGKPLHIFRKTWLRRTLVRLKPDPQPFRGSLMESLTGFEVNERAARAVSLCNLHQVTPLIQLLPRGFDTTIGEMQDHPLSQQLRFRMGVIQALLNDPVALLLDGTFPQLSPICLTWFLGLKLDCIRLVALQRAPDQLPVGVRQMVWEDEEMVEVLS